MTESNGQPLAARAVAAPVLSSDPASGTTQPRPDPANSDESRKRWTAWCELRKRLGTRYAECTLVDFRCDGERAADMRRVVESLTAYADDMPARVAAGQGVVLFGPAGTGKDHLMAALMRAACRHGLSVEWRNGMDLFAERRDAIAKQTPERELIVAMGRPDVLAVSDPVPPSGPLTEGQMEFLFRILDRRYRERRPVWVTANFETGKDAETKIGAQLVDRLRDGALALDCNWPSYRRAAQ